VRLLRSARNDGKLSLRGPRPPPSNGGGRSNPARIHAPRPFLSLRGPRPPPSNGGGPKQSRPHPRRPRPSSSLRGPRPPPSNGGGPKQSRPHPRPAPLLVIARSASAEPPRAAKPRAATRGTRQSRPAPPAPRAPNQKPPRSGGGFRFFFGLLLPYSATGSPMR
jgi:hypothetical protein